MFRSAYSLGKEKFYTASGEKIVDEYGLKVVNGQIQVCVIGKIDIYTPKQEALEGTYLPRMIDRFLNGNMSPIQFDEFVNSHSWQAGDFTDLPKNLMEFENLKIKATGIFNSLPGKIRDLFGQSQERFISEFGSGEALKKLNDYFGKQKAAASTTSVPKSEVDVNE